jgi:Fe-S cluster assembly protein SufD
VGDTAAVVLTVNGRVSSARVAPGPAAKGLEAGLLVEADGGSDLLGAVVGTRSDPFVSLHDALAADPVLIRIPRGVVVTDPIVVVHWIDGDGAAVFPRTVVVAEEESEATVLQIVGSPDDVTTLSVPVTEVSVGPAARLRTMEMQELGAAAWQLGSYFARVGRDASLDSSAVALGAHYARLRLDVELAEKGAEADLIAVYFGEGDQMHDFRTLQDHSAPRTRSDLLFKGAVEDRARSVYSGLIKVRPDAPGTSAFQTNRNIKLSPDAWAESVPNLEIENNDVRCSHASAVGPVDEDQRYYLESRGIPPETAERLIVLGFFDEVIAQLPVAGLQASLRAAVAEKFARRGAGR